MIPGAVLNQKPVAEGHFNVLDDASTIPKYVVCTCLYSIHQSVHPADEHCDAVGLSRTHELIAVISCHNMMAFAAWSQE